MPWFRGRAIYDRRRLLGDAREAARRGRHKRAVALLRQILVREPECVEIHAMIAPSLAKRGEVFDAWESYKRAAHALMNEGRKQQALDVYRDATEKLPRHHAAWNARAALERRLGKAKEAKRTLAMSLPNFRSRKQRAERIALLRQLIAIDPESNEHQLTLAIALSKAGRKHEALHLLGELAERVEPAVLKRIRRRQWEIEPSLAHSWLWFRSAFAR